MHIIHRDIDQCHVFYVMCPGSDIMGLWVSGFIENTTTTATNDNDDIDKQL